MRYGTRRESRVNPTHTDKEVIMADREMKKLTRLFELEQLTGQDAGFFYAETPKAPMHIGQFAIYDPATAPGGKVRFKEILSFIESRVHLAKSFRQKLKTVPMNLDHPYWVDDPDFDLEFHVRHIALPAPGDWRQLCILAARLHSRPLDMTKPLWEFWVVEGLDNIPNIPKGSYAIVSKVHHAAIDGMSGVEITTALHDLSPDVVREEAPLNTKPSRQPGNMELLARAQLKNVSNPVAALNVARNMAPGALKYLDGVRRGEFDVFSNKVPRTRFNSTVSGHRVVGGHSFDLNAIKSMRKKLPDATVNDIMLTIVGGAMRRYLKAKDELQTDSLVAMAPVSVRSEQEKGSMGNEVSALSVAIGTHIEDPLARLHFVHETTTKSKAISNAIGARQLADASKLAPALVSGIAARLYTRLGLANRVRPMFNTVVTNVPGPQVPLYMNGARMVAAYGLGPTMDGLGIFHVVGSYCGEVYLTFTGCRKMLPDHDFYAACIYAAYEELYAATQEKPAPRKRHRSHTKTGETTPSAKTVESKPKKKKSKKKAKASKTAAMAKSDLKQIKGVGPALEKRLNAAGVYSFADIAALKAADATALDSSLDLKGRIKRDGWIKQAKALASA